MEVVISTHRLQLGTTCFTNIRNALNLVYLYHGHITYYGHMMHFWVSVVNKVFIKVCWWCNPLMKCYFETQLVASYVNTWQYCFFFVSKFSCCIFRLAQYLRETKAATTIQKHWRGFITRRSFNRVQNSVLRIQVCDDFGRIIDKT